jgi:hypothetical protein
MHREILSASPDLHVDHINHNGLDNRRNNLRLATRSQNLANQKPRHTSIHSRFKGVTKDISRDRWLTRLVCKNKVVFQGRYDTELEAAKAYDEAAVKFFGDYALTNAKLFGFSNEY